MTNFHPILTSKDPEFEIMKEVLISFGVFAPLGMDQLGRTELGEKFMTLTAGMTKATLILAHKHAFSTDNKNIYTLSRKFVKKHPEYTQMLRISFGEPANGHYLFEAIPATQPESVKKLFKYIINRLEKNPELLIQEDPTC